MADKAELEYFQKAEEAPGPKLLGTEYKQASTDLEYLIFTKKPKRTSSISHFATDRPARTSTSRPDYRIKDRDQRSSASSVLRNIARNLPPHMPSNLTATQLQCLQTDLQVAEIKQKLSFDRIGPNDTYTVPGHHEKSFTPRQALTNHMFTITERTSRTYPSWPLPAGYQARTSLLARVYPPVDEYPLINFHGQILGPRGATQKRLESRSKATVLLRGKGSVREGRGRRDGRTNPGDMDKLHVRVEGSTVQSILSAVHLVSYIVIPRPDEQNAHKQRQLAHLNRLNGTARTISSAGTGRVRGPVHRDGDAADMAAFLDEVGTESPWSAAIDTASKARHDKLAQAVAELQTPEALAAMAYFQECWAISQQWVGSLVGGQPTGGELKDPSSSLTAPGL